jgi:nucleoid DNA-binding protein/DNA-binding CsgD family transcriptional regulator
MTRADMTRTDLISILMNTKLEEHRNLTREQARAVVNEIFGAIAEDLRKGGVARLPLGSFGVYEQERQPMRKWILNRVRVLYKERNVIQFQGGEYDLEPDQRPPTLSRQPPQRLVSSKISPAERRKLTAIGVKAGKSQRLIAQELNVTATTIRRDMKVRGITANKKPTATRRKRAVAWKSSSRATSDRKVAAQAPTKPLKLTPTPTKRIKLPPRPVFPRRVVPEPLQPGPPKQPSPVIPLSPEQLRRQHLEEMLQLVQSWLDEQRSNCQRAENILDKARNSLAASRQDFSVRGLPESPMNAVQLRDYTRPPEMDAAKSQSLSRREEICAQWLAGWLAAWEPQDKQLRNKVLDQTRALVTA